MDQVRIPSKPKRKFLPGEIDLSGWSSIEPYFKQLSERKISGYDDLMTWMRQLSELDAVLEEELAWRYIRMNTNTRDKEASGAFHHFIEKIEPFIAPYKNVFDGKLRSCTFREIASNPAMELQVRKAINHMRVFREENIPIHTKLQAMAQEYGTISAEMSIEWEGSKLTLPKANVILKDIDRQKREKVFKLINNRRLEDSGKLNELFNELISLRHQVARNSGFDNYRDYKFVDLCRFDYDVEHCRAFHKSIASGTLPLLKKFDEERKGKLGLRELRPWDSQVDISGKAGLKPYKNDKDLIEKSIACFNEIDPYFGQCLDIMSKMGHLDLDSREGKAPGGFNYPLYEIGVPFIFMNSAGTLRDMVTMMHEGGHAVHSFLSRDLEITSYKDLPSEVAELASMSMELITMEHWHVFFDKEEDFRRARLEQLRQIVETLPWIAQIDKFQHWIYENPGHTTEERELQWISLMDEFGSPLVDWTGLEKEKRNLWQKQLHLFEVPFYYIEYGMAQLGAIAVWRNYIRDGKKAIGDLSAALSLGYTKPIGEIYKTAGISFDFSSAYVEELMKFIGSEIEALS